MHGYDMDGYGHKPDTATEAFHTLNAVHHVSCLPIFCTPKGNVLTASGRIGMTNSRCTLVTFN